MKVCNRYDRTVAASHLQQADRVLGRFVRAQGKCGLIVRREADMFHALSRSIAYQQLSGKAAATIYSRFLALFPGQNADPEQTCALELQQLRSVGLSGNKSLAILDLAEKVVNGVVPARKKLLRMSDDEITERLCQVRGIGPWTVQMMLMFNLGRPDVLPATDLGVQKGVTALWKMDSLCTPAQLLAQSDPWRPYRSVASWYLWRAADTVLMTDE